LPAVGLRALGDLSDVHLVIADRLRVPSEVRQLPLAGLAAAEPVLHGWVRRAEALRDVGDLHPAAAKLSRFLLDGRGPAREGSLRHSSSLSLIFTTSEPSSMNRSPSSDAVIAASGTRSRAGRSGFVGFPLRWCRRTRIAGEPVICGSPPEPRRTRPPVAASSGTRTTASASRAPLPLVAN